MNTIILGRTVQTLRATYGKLWLYKGTPEERTFRTLELPWLNNQHDVSCIPSGVFTFRRRFSPHNECEVFTGTDIEGRDLINIEVANYARQLKGCIALGLQLFDIDSDGALDAQHSRDAFTQFMDLMRGTDAFTLTVLDPLHKPQFTEEAA